MRFYNEEYKKESLNYNVHKSYVTLFNKSYKYEQKYHKDLFDFNEDEAMELLLSYNQRSIRSLSNIKAVFATYTNWAIGKGLTLSNTNIWTTITLDSTMVVDKASNTMIRDRKEFLRLINAYVDHPYRKLVLFMLYEGFMGPQYSEIRFAKDSDLDMNKKTLHVVRDGKDCYLPVSDEFIRAYESSLNSDLFDKQGSPYLIKNRVKGQAISSSVVNKYVYHFIDAIALKTRHRPEYTSTSIWKSGMYNYIRQQELEYAFLTNDILSACAKRYGYSINKVHLLRKEYTLYKETFGIE